MTVDRRTFLGGIAAAGAVAATARASSAAAAPPRAQLSPDRFDPWLEVDGAALAHNVEVVSRLAGGRPIMAVIKNNAYGLGLLEAARLLISHPQIAGLAVVKPEDAMMLRDARLPGDVLLMGMAPDDAVADLVAAQIHLSLYLDDDVRRLPARASAGTSTIAGHVYLDTGMSRMGIPHHRALPWLETIQRSGAFRIDGAFTAFTEESDFDREQLARFQSVVDEAERAGIALGTLHAASSNGVYHLPEAHLHMVRPGIALFGGYPSRADEERAKAALRPAVALRCRVVRVERLRTGDSVSYGRRYVAERPTWIATLPTGHADGYTRRAVEGARVVIGGKTYPVIGAVSASHVIVEVGEQQSVAIGDVATLIGPEAPEVHPNEVARASGGSVYDVFMHLNPSLPRVVV